MSTPDFAFFIGGIEDGIIARLQTGVGVEAGGYVKTITSYEGEADSGEGVRRALASLAPKPPIMLTCYGDGEFIQDPRTPAVRGEPRIYRHDCTFTVICISNDARGDKARRRGMGSRPGIYQMISDALLLLGGLQFKAPFEDQQILLNPEPLKYAGVECLARLSNLTAYAVHFDTYIRFSETDRRQQGEMVSELIFTVENTYEKGDANLPGVTVE